MTPSSLFRTGCAAVLLAALAGCGAITAQNPSGTLKPVNAVADNPEGRLMLKGADVVAYFTQNKYAQGSPQYRSSYQGVDFRFASAEHKALFDKEPARYLPQYGGYCANGIVYGIPWGGDADTWKLGAVWQINSELRIRASRSRDIRAPNLNDLGALGLNDRLRLLLGYNSAI